MSKKVPGKSRGKKVQVWKLYEVKDGKVERKNKLCPKCKNFLAQMKDRIFCGKCGYSEIGGKPVEKAEEKEEANPKPEEKVEEEPKETEEKKEEKPTEPDETEK